MIHSWNLIVSASLLCRLLSTGIAKSWEMPDFQEAPRRDRSEWQCARWSPFLGSSLTLLCQQLKRPQGVRETKRTTIPVLGISSHSSPNPTQHSSFQQLQVKGGNPHPCDVPLCRLLAAHLPNSDKERTRKVGALPQFIGCFSHSFLNSLSSSFATCSSLG